MSVPVRPLRRVPPLRHDALQAHAAGAEGLRRAQESAGEPLLAVLNYLGGCRESPGRTPHFLLEEESGDDAHGAQS